MQTKAITFGQTQGLRAPARANAPARSRQVVMAAQKGPHEGIMKAALAAAAAAQLFSMNPAMAVGNIQGIEPSRNRDEDKAARAALDSAENKQPPVQGYSFQAPSPSGAVKTGGQRPESAKNSPISALNEKIDEASKPFQRAKGAVEAVKGGNLPTAFSFDTSSLQVNVGAPGSTTAEAGKQIGGGAAGRGGEQDAFNLQGPGTNQSRAAEIQKLNPAKAAESLKNKVKSALPTSNAFDTSALQVNVGLLEKAGDAVDAAKGAAGNIPTPSSVGDAVDAAKGLANKVPGDAGGAFDAAKSAADNKLPGGVDSAVDKAKSVADNKLPGGVDGAVDKAKGLADKVPSGGLGGAFSAAKDAVGNVGDAPELAGAAKRTVSTAQETAINKLGEKAGSLTDGRLKDELENTKDKAPYIQGGPKRAGVEILKLDEPTKKIQSEASKLKQQLTTSAPAFWGSDLQVNVGLFGTDQKSVSPNASKIDAKKLQEASRSGDAGAAASVFGPGQQSATSNQPGGDRPRSTETSDFRAGEAGQSQAQKFGAPTAIAKKISGQETV